MIDDPGHAEGVDILRENDSYVESLQTAVERGEFSLDLMPSLVTQVVRERRWQRRYVRSLQREVEFSRFSDFVTAKTPEGLGASIEMLKRMCSDDPEALESISSALKGTWGGDRGNQYTGGKSDIITLAKEKSHQGTSREYAISRLKSAAIDRDTGEVLDPKINQLYEAVLAGEMSPNAAAIEAGFRKRMLSIPVDDAERAARSIRANMPPEVVNKLAALLRGGG